MGNIYSNELIILYLKYKISLKNIINNTINNNINYKQIIELSQKLEDFHKFDEFNELFNLIIEKLNRKIIEEENCVGSDEMNINEIYEMILFYYQSPIIYPKNLLNSIKFLKYLNDYNIMYFY